MSKLQLNVSLFFLFARVGVVLGEAGSLFQVIVTEIKHLWGSLWSQKGAYPGPASRRGRDLLSLLSGTR